ncbi:ABC transporter permease [Actinopolymorpha alba]|uniref:ABC transporter permease n=1 Tax=Actinopolymorpha alba TaxID=533267 RepID=UPI000365FEE9|nr:hypothetical protein [Actinopolymorpha alba]
MNALVGTGGLIRLILRRDRFILPAWIVLLAVIPVSYVSGIEELYPTAAGRAQYAATSGTNPTFLALYGPLHSTSVGGLVAQRAGFLPLIVGLIALLTVIRHTRGEEEAGRRELLGSTVVGRHAGLAAALIVTMTATLVLGLLSGLVLTSGGLPASGAFTLTLSWTFAGWVFAAVAGVAAQLTEGAGAARGIALGVLGLAFVLRVAGDVGGTGNELSWLSWLSPIGWAHGIQAFGGERWWVLVLSAALAAVLIAVATAVSARRDVGAGILAARLGPADAAPGLRSPFALAWRLHRGLLMSWTAGFVALGLIFGGVADGVGDMVEDNPQLQEIFARMGGRGGLIDLYLAGIMGILGLIASAYAIQAALRLRSEEANLRAEPLLATAVGRLRWAGSHLVFSVLGPVVALLAAGATAGLVHGLNAGDVGEQLPRALGAALVQLPAVWVLTGIAVALFGLLPRVAAASWGAFALFLFLGQVGAVLGLDQWMLDVSPFTHIPKVPGGAVTAEPLLWLLAVTLVLMLAGLVGFRRRDAAVG